MTGLDLKGRSGAQNKSRLQRRRRGGKLSALVEKALHRNLAPTAVPIRCTAQAEALTHRFYDSFAMGLCQGRLLSHRSRVKLSGLNVFGKLEPLEQE